MKDTFNVLFLIRKTRLLKNGEAAIQMRLTVNGQFVELYSKRQVNPKFWNQKKGQAVGKSPELIEINRHLMNLRARAFEIQTELENEGIEANALAIKDRLLRKDEKPKPKLFFEEFQAHNDECTKLINIEYAKSTVDRYKLCLVYFKEMYKQQSSSPDLPICNVTGKMIRDFEIFLKTEKGICNNTCIRYLKCVQKIINIAFNNGWIRINPFANIKFKEDKTKVEFLTMEEVERMMAKEFSIKRLEHVRDVFVFCCYHGLAFIDAWQLKDEFFEKDKNGQTWIRKERQKTKVEFNVPILDIPNIILDKYKDDPECLAKGTKLPMPTNQKMNSYLKEIADLCGINKRLTTHLARYTYATTITLWKVSVKVRSYKNYNNTNLCTHS